MLPDPPLPRLAYIGYVPVEYSLHGSILLYRLLKHYPKDKLLIIEAGPTASLPERRIPDVPYHVRSLYRFPRLLKTRFHKSANLFNTLLAPTHRSPIDQLLQSFRPEAILTVTHDTSWLAAVHYAQHYSLPYHLICHDEWLTITPLPKYLSPVFDRIFKRYYRQAASRLCVSRYMAEAYEERYQAKGIALYPSRGKDQPIHLAPPERLKESHPLTVAFIGSPYKDNSLQIMAQELQKIGGQINLYGAYTEAHARRDGFYEPNMIFRGFIPSHQLIHVLRDEVDVLYVMMSFETKDRNWMSTAFPSKLVDYTAIGLPILIRGPSYCTAVRWAQENPGVAEVVTDPSPQALYTALQKLQSPHYRHQLAQKAIEIGRDFFSYEKAWHTFTSALRLHNPL
jgi:hypothetical protein